MKVTEDNLSEVMGYIGDNEEEYPYIVVSVPEGQLALASDSVTTGVIRRASEVELVKEYFSNTIQFDEFSNQPSVMTFASNVAGILSDAVGSLDTSKYIKGQEEETLDGIETTVTNLQNFLENLGRALQDDDISQEDVADSYKTAAEDTLQDVLAAYETGFNPLIATELQQIVVRKNLAYGNSFDKAVETWGVVAAAIRISDKVNRLHSLLDDNNTNMVNDENVTDTIVDIMGYLILGINYYTK